MTLVRFKFFENGHQEILKVRGFQVAPAELEGHLLDHDAVADACVVGVPDPYSGEVPLAFVALNAKAADRVKKDPSEADKLKKEIEKVSRCCVRRSNFLTSSVSSTSQMRRLHTSISRAESSSLMPSQRTPVESC